MECFVQDLALRRRRLSAWTLMVAPLSQKFIDLRPGSLLRREEIEDGAARSDVCFVQEPQGVWGCTAAPALPAGPSGYRRRNLGHGMLVLSLSSHSFLGAICSDSGGDEVGVRFDDFQQKSAVVRVFQASEPSIL